MSDMVRIGYVHNNRYMKLSQFCYAILNGMESELFPEEDTQQDEEDENDYNPKRTVSVGVAPNVEGDFEPFVYYTKIEGSEEENPDQNLSHVEKEIIGDMSLITSCYVWKSDEKGWIAPNFFNASFPWLYTVYKEKEGEIIVVKKEESTGARY